MMMIQRLFTLWVILQVLLLLWSTATVGWTVCALGWRVAWRGWKTAWSSTAPQNGVAYLSLVATSGGLFWFFGAIAIVGSLLSGRKQFLEERTVKRPLCCQTRFAVCWLVSWSFLGVVTVTTAAVALRGSPSGLGVFGHLVAILVNTGCWLVFFVVLTAYMVRDRGTSRDLRRERARVVEDEEEIELTPSVDRHVKADSTLPHVEPPEAEANPPSYHSSTTFPPSYQSAPTSGNATSSAFSIMSLAPSSAFRRGNRSSDQSDIEVGPMGP